MPQISTGRGALDKPSTRPAVPGYWKAAVKRAWATFSAHTGVAGLALPVLTGVFGYIVGARDEDIGVLLGVLSGVGVSAAYYAILLLFVTPRQLWIENQKRLLPALEIGYDESNSLFMPEVNETYRLRICNTGVESITGAIPRVMRVSTAPYLDVPIILRERGGNAPFTLNDNAPLFVDFLEIGPPRAPSFPPFPGTAHLVYATLCGRTGTPLAPLIFTPGSAHEVAIELQANQLRSITKYFRITCTLPNRRRSYACLDVSEIEELSASAPPKPKLVIRHVRGETEEDEHGQTYEYEGFEFRNIGNATATNITLLPFEVLGFKIRQVKPIPVLTPIELQATGYATGDLHDDLMEAWILQPERDGKRPPLNIKVQLQYDWEHRPEDWISVHYVLSYSPRGVTIRSVHPDEHIIWTDLDALGNTT